MRYLLTPDFNVEPLAVSRNPCRSNRLSIITARATVRKVVFVVCSLWSSSTPSCARLRGCLETLENVPEQCADADSARASTDYVRCLVARYGCILPEIGGKGRCCIVTKRLLTYPGSLIRNFSKERGSRKRFKVLAQRMRLSTQAHMHAALSAQPSV